MPPVGAASDEISGPVIFPPAVAAVADDGRVRRTAHRPLIEEPQAGQRLCLTFVKQNDAFEPDAAPIKQPVTSQRAERTFRRPPGFPHLVACDFSQLKVL